MAQVKRARTVNGARYVQFGGSYKKRGKFFRKSSYKNIMRTSSTSGKTQKAQIASLAKRVNSLAQVQQRRTDSIQFGLTNLTHVAGSPWTIGSTDDHKSFSLMKTQGTESAPRWEPIFGTDTTQYKKNLLIKSLSINYVLHGADEHQGQFHHLFILIPKTKQVHDDYYSVGLINGTDYYSGSRTNAPLSSGNVKNHGRVFINYKRWRVLHSNMGMTMGATQPDGSDVPTAGLKVMRGKLKLNCNWTIQGAMTDNFSDVAYDKLAHWMKPTVVVFSDDSTSNSESTELRFNMLAACQTYD